MKFEANHCLAMKMTHQRNALSEREKAIQPLKVHHTKRNMIE